MSATFYYATSGRVLGAVDARTLQSREIGPTPVTFTDIAVAPSGRLYGVTFSGLYAIDRDTGDARFVAALPSGSVNAFTIDARGRGYVADTGGALFRLDPATGAAEFLARGPGSAGDLVFHDGGLWLSATGARLARIDPRTGAVEEGFFHGIGNLYGLASTPEGLFALAGRTIYAVDLDAARLDPAASLPFGPEVFGADAAPLRILTGGRRDDVFRVRDETDRVVETRDGGDDLVRSSVSFALPAHVERLELLGRRGLDGAGNGLDNVLRGNDGDNVLRGRDGDDRLFGGGGDDRLLGGEGADRLFGGQGRDRLEGGPGRDRLDGGAGRDRLEGGAGGDTLVGGVGRDVMAGGAGADVFLFRSARDSGRGDAADRIRDFERGRDAIDLSGIDADPGRPGRQAFDFIGGRAFPDEPGALRYADGRLAADRDGDGRADFEIALDGVARLAAADLIL